MLFEAGVQLPLGFTHIGGVTVIASNLVHHTGLIKPVQFVFGVNQSASDGVEGPNVGGDACLPDVSGYGFGHGTHKRKKNAALWSSVCCGGGVSECGDTVCGGPFPCLLGVARHTEDFLEVLYLVQSGVLLSVLSWE